MCVEVNDERSVTMSISVIDNAPEYVGFGVRQLSAEGWTSEQLVEWLAGHGIRVSPDSVNYHLRKNGVHTDRKWWIEPADTFDERMQQYIVALNECDTNTFRIWDLNLRGRVWNVCTRRLINNGIIEKVPNQRRWYKILVTKDKLDTMSPRGIPKQDADDAVARAARECSISY